MTLWGSLVNLILTVGKILAGIIGRSGAMLADGMHSLSDFISDVIVLVFVRVSSKERDKDHDFGHGKFETFATLVVAVMLGIAAVEIGRGGIENIVKVFNGEALERPGMIAFWAALASVIAKELMYQWTVRVGKAVDSPVVIANAWHHRSDALSSIGSMIGIGGAILLGDKWTVLDPLTAVIISVMIFIVAAKMALPAVRELLDVSLPEEMEKEIVSIIESIGGVEDVHELKTLRNGPSIVIEAHVVVDPMMTVWAAHDICDKVEDALRDQFGAETQISIHVEPFNHSK